MKTLENGSSADLVVADDSGDGVDVKVSLGSGTQDAVDDFTGRSRVIVHGPD